MLVVSRKPSESVIVESDDGSDVTVTVVHVGPRRVTLKIDYFTDVAEMDTEVIAVRSEVVPLGDCGNMTIVDVRGGLVRLGFELPKGVEIHRKEVCDSQRVARAGAAVASAGKSVVAAPDQTIAVGGAVTITPTDVDPAGVRVLVRGELLGGPDDGLRINEPREMRIGGVLQLGTQITVTLAAVAGPRARFLVIAPPHMSVGVR
jgi:sRNA-binding carbon storage regulator CsrA